MKKANREPMSKPPKGFRNCTEKDCGMRIEKGAIFYNQGTEKWQESADVDGFFPFDYCQLEQYAIKEEV